MSMVGYVITVNPKTSVTTWSGLTQSFTLDTKGSEIGTSEFQLPNFTGEVDDLLAMRIFDGAGNLTPDNRVSGANPAFYYGVITAVDRDTNVSVDENSNEDLTAKVQCSDHKSYVNSDYIPENGLTQTTPFIYLKTVYDRWLIENNQNGIPMTCVSSTVSYTGPTFTYPAPAEATTESLMTLFGRAFTYYQIPLVVTGDNINNSSNADVQLNAMFISGVNIGTVMIDDSVMVRGAKVTERPVGDDDYNGVSIGKVNNKKTTTKTKSGKKTTTTTTVEYQNVTITRRWMQNDGTVTSAIDTENVRKPVKMKAFVQSEDDKTEVNDIAKNELSITPYSHEITFNIHKNHKQVNGLIQLGNLVTLFYKGKFYKSIVSGAKISSDSDYIEISCGNVISKLESLIDAALKGSATSTTTGGSSSSSSSSSGGTANFTLASTSDIDNFFT